MDWPLLQAKHQERMEAERWQEEQRRLAEDRSWDWAEGAPWTQQEPHFSVQNESALRQSQERWWQEQRQLEEQRRQAEALGDALLGRACMA